ncbi:hypothetical protein ACU1JV_14970 [Paenibacillus sp. T2-29]
MNYACLTDIAVSGRRNYGKEPASLPRRWRVLRRPTEITEQLALLSDCSLRLASESTDI